MISWVNPDETMSKTTLSDYLKDGLVEAIEQVKK